MVGIGVCPHRLTVSVLVYNLTVAACCERLRHAAVFLPCLACRQPHLGTAHGFAGGGVDNRYPDFLAGERLGDGEQVRHVQQTPLWRYVLVVGAHYKKVYTNRQWGEGHRVGALLIGCASYVPQLLVLYHCTNYVLLYLHQVLPVVRVQPGVAGQRCTVQCEVELRNVPYGVHPYQSRCLGQQHDVAGIDVERWPLKLCLGIAQVVQARPSAPLAQRVVYVLHLLGGRGIVGVLHALVPLHCQFSSHFHVFVDGYQRV